MKLQKFVAPLLLVFTLLFTACAAPAATTETAAEAPAAAEATPPEAPAEEPTAEPVEEATATPVAESPAESSAAEGEAATYVVDTAASKIEWYGSKPIGASESGTVNIAEGEMSFNGDQLVGGTIVIDMASIATTTQSGGMAEQLVGHLASDDFFGVATYPTAQLVLKSAEPTDVANQYRVKADLTIKETTKEIEFVTDVVVAEDTLTGNANIVVNRADFDVRYNSAAFFSNLGDNLISDEMEMTVMLVAKKG
jgi:polyisoprenoid-binding protein YceI